MLGLDKKSHELSVKLNQALRECDNASREIKNTGGKAKVKLEKHLGDIQKETGKLLEGIVKMQTGTKKGLEWQKDAEVVLAKIEGGKPNWSKNMEKGLKCVDIVVYMSIADWGEKAATAALTTARLALTEVDKNQASKLETN